MWFFAVIFFLIALIYSQITKVQYTVHEVGYVLITGASTGIGRHSAEYIANTTRLTVLAGVRKESDLVTIKELGIPNLLPLLVDVTSQRSCEMAIETVTQMVKDNGIPLVAVVNNAGMSRRSSIEYHTMDDAYALFEVNFFGVLRLTQLSLPLLRESKGRIIMVSSIAGIFSRSMAGMYSSTKFALEALSDALRREVAHFGVSVSVIQPAFVKTSIFESAATVTEKMHTDPDMLKQIADNYGRYAGKTTRESLKKIYDAGSDPIVTSEVIKDAIVAPNPKTRYPVASTTGGLTAKALTWIFWILPDRLEDKILNMSKE